MVVRFDDNACVLINKAGEPLGTRVNGEFFFCLGLGGGRGLRDSRKMEFVSMMRRRSLIESVCESGADGFKGVVGAELRDKHWSKILSLAPMHV